MEVDEQKRHTAELTSALQGQETSELELRLLVETGLSNYKRLFRIKAAAANADVFYDMSGLWKTPAERFFLLIGGFRPSDVLKDAGERTSGAVGPSMDKMEKAPGEAFGRRNPSGPVNQTDSYAQQPHETVSMLLKEIMHSIYRSGKGLWRGHSKYL
ncbi:Transcription factor TGA4 [Zea mays]|uniref:Transcription factor TGA4 n=1 Tax=Zea mays TaxID=4577 RepID=A0A1D6MW11_MAIZE|nr:Transcription factor TGA4 [Zea mays]